MELIVVEGSARSGKTNMIVRDYVQCVIYEGTKSLFISCEDTIVSIFDKIKNNLHKCDNMDDFNMCAKSIYYFKTYDEIIKCIKETNATNVYIDMPLVCSDDLDNLIHAINRIDGIHRLTYTKVIPVTYMNTKISDEGYMHVKYK